MSKLKRVLFTLPFTFVHAGAMDLAAQWGIISVTLCLLATIVLSTVLLAVIFSCCGNGVERVVMGCFNWITRVMGCRESQRVSEA